MSEREQEAPRPTRHHRRSRLRRAFGWFVAGLIACTIALAAVGYIALPALEQRPQLLGRWLGEYIQRKVTLREFELVWSDGAPLLRIRGLAIAADNDAHKAFSISTADVRIDMLRSIVQRNIRPQSVIVRGAHLRLQRNENGTISAAGFADQGDTTLDETFTGVLAAFPDNALLGIEQATVTLHGFGAQPGSAQPLVLHPVSAHLHHGSDGVRFSATAALADFSQALIRTTVRWSNSQSSPTQASEFTLNARDLPISVLPQHWRPHGFKGRLNAAVDGEISEHAVRTMRGTLKLGRMNLVNDTGTHAINSAQSLIEYIDDAVGWRLSLLRLQTRTATGLSEPSMLTLHGKSFAAPHTLELDQLPLSTILPLLRIFAPSSPAIELITSRLLPEGHIEDLKLDLSGELSSMQLQQMRMRIRNVVLLSVDQQLQLGPLDASLVTQGREGTVQLFPALIRLDLGTDDQGQARNAQFTGDGTLRWRRSEDGLLIDSDGINFVDGQLRAQLTGSVRVPDPGDEPELDLHLHGAALDEPTFKRYLALELLPGPLSDWLTQAISVGRLSEFRADLSGSPTSAIDLSGLLDLQASFENVTLRYLQGWPDLVAMDGQFTLHKNQFTISVDKGQAGGARIVSTTGRIDDIMQDGPILNLQGHVIGRAEDGTAFVSATPLGQKFGPLMQQLSATGEATLALDITVPLSEEPLGVRGELKLKNAELRIHALRSAFAGVSGALSFDADGLTKGRLKARYLQREINMSLNGMLERRSKTRLVIDGETDPEGLLRHLYDVGAVDSNDPSALPLLGRLSGRTNWQVTMDLVKASTSRQFITMAVRSDLQGMALDLPPPLGKSLHESRPLQITATLLGENMHNRRFQVRYGKSLHALMEMSPQGTRGFALRRGALRLGGGDATLGEQQGISVRGTVDVISVDDWAALIADIDDPSQTPTNDSARPLDYVKRVQIDAQKLVALGAVFDNVRLEVSHDKRKAWFITTKGSGIDGTITIAQPTGATPIDARFERLHVRRNDAASASNNTQQAIIIEPGALPSASVVVQRLRYNDIELGLSKLVLEPMDGGLALREIFALSEAFEIRGTGQWIGPATNAQSRLKLHLHSNDFGQFTDALGFRDSGIEGGVAEIAINANWQGSPFAFALDEIQGELHFRGTGGRLRDVEPGASGRVFGLFNLTVLPRRLLLLDFKDLFEEGVSYESIEGSFSLSGGNAVTKDVEMHTQNAKVQLAGRVGLVAEDYDQIMTVTPKLSASLPLAPIWLAEKLLKRTLIDNAFAYQYIITGGWKDPKVERVRIEVPERESR